MIPLIAVQGPRPKSLFLYFLSPTQKVNGTQSHYSTSSFSMQSEDPTRIQLFYFFPDPKSQHHPRPLLNNFLLTAVQGPNQNSVFYFVPRPKKSTAPNPITQQFTSHCSPRAHHEFSSFHVFPDPQSQQHPIPLFNILSRTAVQGPNPNSSFFFHSFKKSAAPNPITQHIPSHCSLRTQPEFNVLLLSQTNKSITPNLITQHLPPHCSPRTQPEFNLQSKDSIRTKCFDFLPNQ